MKQLVGLGLRVWGRILVGQFSKLVFFFAGFYNDAIEKGDPILENYQCTYLYIYIYR